MRMPLLFRLRRRLRWMRPKITGKLIAYLLLVSVVPLLLYVASTLNLTRRVVLKLEQDYSSQLLLNQRDYLSLITEQVESLAANIANVEDISNVLATVDIDAGFERSAYHELSTQAKIGYILNGYTNLRGLVSIDLFSYLGYHFHVGEPLPAPDVNDLARQRLYQTAVEIERPLLWMGMQPNLNLKSKQPQVISAVKLIYHYYPKTQQSNPVGMLVINYSPDYLHQYFSRLNFGKDSQFMVIDQSQRLIFHPDKSQIGQPVAPALGKLLHTKINHSLVNLDGQATLFSQATLNNTGWRVVLLVPEQTLLLPMRGLLHNAGILLVLCFALMALVAWRYTRTVVVPIRAISSGFRHIQRMRSQSLRPLPIPTNKDEIAEMVLWFNAFLDGVRAREQHEKELLQAKLAADQANQSKSEFLANMSHEIRTPMNAILGMTQLAMQTNSEAERSNYLQKAHRAANSLLGIINDILDISKIEAGKIQLEHIPFTLPQILAEVAEVFATSAQEKGVELLFDVDAELRGELLGDPLRLRQILLNLVGNALKFTAKGCIVVHVQLLHRETGYLKLRFAVQDSGIGISSEQQKRLFQQFSQADSSTTRRYGGTGLGLSICKHFVELMGGEIGVISQPDQGSEFFFSVVLGSADVLAPPLSPLPRQPQLLIVDTLPQAGEILQRMARPLGLTAQLCQDEAQAIAYLQQQTNPDYVLLLAYPLPDANGVNQAQSCLQNLRSLAGRAHMPVIWCCSQELPEAQFGRASHILNKPFLLSALHQVLLQVCGQAVAPPTKPAREERMRAFREQLAGRRILLVEDNLLNQELALALLRNVGIHADLAENGQQALDKLKQGDYELILMDCQMPVMDGYQATRQLRSNPAYADLPVIALTAHALVGEREKSLAAGMNEHLTKPVKPDLLYETMQRLLPTASQIPSGLDQEVDAIMMQLADQQRAMNAAPAHFQPQAALENLLGNQQMYERMATLFQAEAVKFAAQFRTAWQNGSINDARRHAHTMKSSAGIVGALYLQELARELEQACQIEGNVKIPALLQMMEEELAKVMHSLQQYIAGEEAVASRTNAGNFA